MRKKKFLSKERVMKKRFILLAMVLVMMLVSIGGCWVGWHEGGGGGRGEGHDKGGGGHEKHEGRR
jgi:hypothetical protein